MTKFLKGDGVRVKKGYAHSGFGGKVIEVKKGPRGDVVIIDDDNGHRLAFNPDELEEAGTTPLSAPG